MSIMSVVKDFKMDYFLLKNALKGHNLVLFGSFSLPIQDFFGGPNRSRTDDQAVAVPCLTTWLQGLFNALFYYKENKRVCQLEI